MKKNIFDDNWGFKEKRRKFVKKEPDTSVSPHLFPQWKKLELKDLKKQYADKMIDGIQLSKRQLAVVKLEIEKIAQ